VKRTIGWRRQREKGWTTKMKRCFLCGNGDDGFWLQKTSRLVSPSPPHRPLSRPHTLPASLTATDRHKSPPHPQLHPPSAQSAHLSQRIIRATKWANRCGSEREWGGREFVPCGCGRGEEEKDERTEEAEGKETEGEATLSL
jgi:hypothetical protein